MPLMCDLGWHRADPMARWNNGYYFSKCTRCGRDLVRTAYAGWHVPKGYKVVWQNKPPEHGKASAPVHEPLIAMPAASLGARGATSDAELPIQAVLRHLNARDLSSDEGVGGADRAEEVAPAAAPNETFAVADVEEVAVDPVAAEEIEIGQVEIAVTEVSRLDEPEADGLDQQDGAFELPVPATESVMKPEDTAMEESETLFDPEVEKDEAAPGTEDEVVADENTSSVPVPPLGEVREAETLETASVDDPPVEEAQEHAPADGGDLADEPERRGEDDARTDEAPESIEHASEPAAEPVVRISFDDFMEDDSDLINWDDGPPSRSVAPVPVPPPEAAWVDETSESAPAADAEGSSQEASPLAAPQVDWVNFDERTGSEEEAEAAAAPPPLAEDEDSSRADPTPLATESGDAPRKTISFGGQVAVTGALIAGVVILVAAVADRPRADPVAAAAQPAPDSASQITEAAAPGDLAQARETGFVTARILNCRASPVAQASSVKKLSRGATVEILAREADWLSLSHRGRQCWAAARFISTDRPA